MLSEKRTKAHGYLYSINKLKAIIDILKKKVWKIYISLYWGEDTRLVWCILLEQLLFHRLIPLQLY